MKYLLPVTLILGSVALLGAGCGSSSRSEQTYETPNGEVRVNTNEDRVELKDNKTGNSVNYGTNATIPEDFPKVIPIYPDGQPLTVSMVRTGEQSATIMTKIKDTPSVSAAWYGKTLTQAGWKESTSYSLSGSEGRTYEKDGDTITLGISPNTDEGFASLATLVYTPKAAEKAQQ